MTGALIAKQFGLNHSVTHRNLSDMTHDESLVHPGPAGNCANWVLGHIVGTRNFVMAALGEPPVWTEDEAAGYTQGSKPLTADRARRLEDLLAALDRSQALMTEKIGALDQSGLDRTVGPVGPLGEQSVAERLMTLSFHESYHVGQFGLLRRLLGKANAIG